MENINQSSKKNQNQYTPNNLKNSSNKKSKENLAIYQKYMELIDYTNNILRKFPKSETFALVSEIKGSIYSGLKCLMYAIKSYSKEKKLHYLNELDINLSLTKVQIRLSHKYKCISTQNYTTWSALITDISNMLGGWITSCQKR